MRALINAKNLIEFTSVGEVGPEWIRTFILTDLKDLVEEIERCYEAMATMAARDELLTKERD